MEEQTTQGIDLSVFLHNFRRTLQHFFWVPIVLGLLLGGVSWLRAARSYAPVYQSSAVFSVSAGFSSSTDILSHSTYLDSNAAAQLSATFPYVLQSDRMQLLLQQELGDQRAPVSLSASSVADAALFTLRDGALGLGEKVPHPLMGGHAAGRHRGLPRCGDHHSGRHADSGH